MKQASYTVTGMSCSACSSRVEQGVSKLPGVSSCQVNLLTGSMRVEYDERLLSSDGIVEKVRGLGYGASPKEAGGRAARPAAGDGQAARDDEERRLKRRFLLSLCLLVPLMYVAMHHMLLEWFGLPVPEWFKALFHGEENVVTFALTQLLLLLPIIALNAKFYSSGFRALALRAPNMDTLVALGSGAALVYSILVLYLCGWGLGHGDMALVERHVMDFHFESAGTILTLITLGKWLESRSKARTGQALRGLMALSPETARVERDGAESEIPAADVAVGDVVVVRPGDRVPVDGEVLSGAAGVDESVITGESLPAEKGPGDRVTSGTISRSGFIRVRALRVGADMAISRIIRLVEDAAASKAPVSRLADRIAGVFVPAVMAAALLAFAYWMAAGAGLEFALTTGIAVLVISCPCALGLATPVAIMVGTGRGAELGVLFKSGEALERAHAVDTVVLDKTGTVTEGKPVVTDVLPASGSAEDLLRLAAAIERGSGHPLADAVTARAEAEGLTVPDADEFALVPGRGVSARVGGVPCHAGSLAMMDDLGADPGFLRDVSLSIAEAGRTPLFVARGTEVAGLLAVADRVRPTSAGAVADLKAMGVRVVMLTGDNEHTARAIQRQVGVDEVEAGVLPEDKETRIAAMQREGRVVAMVGDGVNDAPALARADLGVAMGAGTDVAMESADVVLVRSDLGDAVTALRLGRAVLRNIRENLFWAFFYNAAGIPLAAGVFYGALGWKLDPMFAAAAMSLSSVCVVTNALRLRRFGPRADKAAPRPAEERPADRPPAARAASAPGGDGRRLVLHVEGMMCGHCEARVRDALLAQGCVEAEASHETGTARVSVPGTVAADVLRGAVEEAGYRVLSVEDDRRP